MLKAGLVGAAAGFVLGILGAIAFPLLCNPCAAVFVGLAAGFLSGVFTRGASGGSSAGEGAKAGAIATAGSMLGQMIGTVIMAVSVDGATAAQAAAVPQLSDQLTRLVPGLTPCALGETIRFDAPIAICGEAGIRCHAGNDDASQHMVNAL